MFISVIFQTLLAHTIFVWLACMCNIIYKETWYSDSAHLFCIPFVHFKEWKRTIKRAFSLKYSAQIPILYHTQKTQKMVKDTLNSIRIKQFIWPLYINEKF